MKNIFLVSIFLIFTRFSAGAQDKLILTTGDTLSGSIDILLPEPYFEEIFFSNEDTRERYKAHEFLSFTHEGTKYRTIKFGDVYRIMEVEKEGYLSILNYRSDQSYAFNSNFLYKRGGEGIEVPNFLFRKTIGNFLKECGPVQEAIVNGEYRRRDIEALVEAYNSCMETQTRQRMAEYEKQELIKANSPLIDEFTNLNKQAKQMGDQELSNMLADVIDKMENSENIPNYLKNALLDHVREGHQLKQAVEVLVKQL